MAYLPENFRSEKSSKSFKTFEFERFSSWVIGPIKGEKEQYVYHKRQETGSDSKA